MNYFFAVVLLSWEKPGNSWKCKFYLDVLFAKLDFDGSYLGHLEYPR